MSDQKMSDQKIDTLYSLCFNQMVRCTMSPTYVEKRILDELVNCTRIYILQFVDELKKKVSDESKKCEESYLTWNLEFYKKDRTKKEKFIAEFEKTLKTTETDKFLGVDFTKINSVIDDLYPGVLPSSNIRESLWDQWCKIKEKHN
jgi:hypothetical protein